MMASRVLLAALLALGAFAQLPPQQPVGAQNQPAAGLPEQVKDVGVDQKLDGQVPMDAIFTDETGAKRPFREYLSGRPAILAPVYYECPMLCHMILNGVLRTVRVMSMTVGKEFDVIALSFDPAENAQNARAKKFEYTERYHRPGTEMGWRFLTGSETEIRRMMDSIGYRYKKDPGSTQWIHASAIALLTPVGKISKYFFGVEYSARDLRLGLVEASSNKIGTVVDQVLLYCFHYDAATAKYSLTILRIMRVAAAATILALLAFWYISWRQNRKRNVERLPAIS